jgi:hypothetical protein
MMPAKNGAIEAPMADAGDLGLGMWIYYSPPSKEICIVGSGDEFRMLASIIRQTRGKVMSNQTGSPVPYEMLLKAIVVESLPAHGVTFRVTTDNQLSIAGDKSKMVMLADSVQGIAEADDVEGHWHLEYLPDHLFLDPGSFPVVFEFSSSARNQKLSTLQ